MATDWLEKNAQKRTAALKGIKLVATDLAATLANDNPEFDKARFMKACGFDD